MLKTIQLILTLIGKSIFKPKKVYSRDQKKNMALSYLKEKYGEEFVAKSIISSSWGQSHDELYFYPQSRIEDNSFVVWGTTLDNGTYAIHDGYFGLIIKNEYEKVISSFVKEIYSDFKLKTDFEKSICPDRLNKDTKIDEIYKMGERFYSHTTIYVKQSSAEGINLDDSLEKIAKKMIESKLTGSVKIYVILDDKYDTLALDFFANATQEQRKAVLLYDGKQIDVDNNLNILKYKGN